jgi:hypothetical protein
MSDLVTQYRGRVIDSPGDKLLAEFVSMVDAVPCASRAKRALSTQRRNTLEMHHRFLSLSVSGVLDNITLIGNF